MSMALQIADAVVDVINGSDLGVTAERWYVPVLDIIRDLTELKVSVVPRAITGESLSRRSDDFRYLVDVAVQKRLPNDCVTNTQIKIECDPLMTLTQDIIDLFRGKTLANGLDATCVSFENPFIFSPDHLDEKRVWTSIATLHFKKDRARS